MEAIQVEVIDTEPLGYRGAVAIYLLKTSKGAVLIDTGFPSNPKTIFNKISDREVRPGEIRYVLITHAHLDHMGSAASIAELAPDAKFVIHVRGERHLLNPVRLLAGSKMALGESFVRKLGTVGPISKDRILIVKDGDVIELGDMLRLRIIETAGHTPDHISIYEETSRYLFTGDAVCNYYPGFQVFVPPASPPIYPTKLVIRSIERLKSFEPDRIYTPHFGRVEIEPNEYFESNIRVVSEWEAVIERLLSERYNFIEIVDHFKRALLEESGLKLEDLEPYFREIFLPVMVRVSVMGYMGSIINTIR